MKQRIVIFFIALLVTVSSFAQLSGTYNVPLNYSSIAAAITDLNTQGIIGSVTIQINAGYTEIAPVGGYSLTATGTSLNPITFSKQGIGANPLIIAYSGGTATPSSAIQDGVWRLIGSDYITIDGIDINDPNGTNPATMEYGFGFFKLSSTDGCQYNTIKNCVIRLNRINNANGSGPSADGSRGINMVSALPNSQTTALAPTSVNGSHSFNKFYNNTIQNCNIGISLIGFAVSSPYTFADDGNEIGSPLAFSGNIIQNYGGATGATNPAAGIRSLAQYNLTVENNVIQNNNGSGINHPTTLRGIYLNTALDANVSVTGNTITLNSDASNAPVAAIENLAGGSGTNNTVSIKDNLIQNCSGNLNTSGAFYGIYNNAASCSTLDISGNFFDSNTFNASTGSCYMIYNTGSVSSLITFTNNLIVSSTFSASTTGNFYGLMNGVLSSAWLNISSNTLDNISTIASSGSFYGVYNLSSITNSITLQNNSILNSTHIANANGSYYGVFNNGVGSNDLSLNLNSFISNTLTLQNGNAYLIYNTGSNTQNISINNNTFTNSKINFNSTGSFFSIYNNAAGANQLQINNNTYTNNTQSATSGSIQVIFNRGTGANTFTTISMSGNLIGNSTFTSNSSSPFAGIYNSGVTSASLTVEQNTITNINWLGANIARYLIYNTGSILNQTLLNDNLISNCTSSLNTTAVFYGIYNTGSAGTRLNFNQNSFHNIFNSATNGSTYLFYNSGAVASGSIAMLSNTISSFSNTATGNGSFFGLYNTGSNQNSVQLSSNTFTNCSFISATGSIVGVNNNGPANATILNTDFNNNLFASTLFSLTSNGNSYGIYNSTASSQTLSINTNSFLNCIYNAANGSNYLIYNSGGVTSTFSSIGMNLNVIQNCIFSSASTAPFYTLWNNGVTSNYTSISSNSITNSNWNTVSSLKYLLANFGVTTNSAAINNNFIASCNFTMSTNGSLYGIYYNNNTINSSGDISIKNNVFNSINRIASTGETHFINLSGISNSMYNSVAIENNAIASCSVSISGTGPLYGIYNNSASTNTLSVVSNTFNGNLFNIFSGACYLVNTRGIGGSIITEQNYNFNLVSNHTGSVSSNGTFFGFYINGTGTSTCTNLSLSDNTFTNATLQSSTGAIYFINSSFPVTNSITIQANIFGTISNTLTTTGAFYGIYNSSSSLTGDLHVRNNMFSNLNSSASSGIRYLIYNIGGRGNSILIENNSIANCIHQASGNASYYIINNNSNSSGSFLSISNNSLSAHTTSLTSGANYYILNSGALSTTINTVLLENNRLNNYTLMATSGQLFGITNTGITSDVVSIFSNTIQLLNRQAVSGNQQLFVNSGRVTNSLNINSNLVSSYSSTLNTSGAFFGVSNTLNFANGNFPVNLSISNNTFGSVDLSSTTGQIYYINNTATASNTVINCTLSSNEISSQQHTVTSGANVYGIYSSGITYSVLSVNTNSLTNIQANTTSSTRYLFYNNGIILNSATYSGNLISNYTSTLNGTGSFYAFINQGNSSGLLSIASNSISGLQLNASTGSSYLLYNTMNMDAISMTSNYFSSITHSNSGSGTFYGVFNQVAGANSLTINSNTLNTIDLSSTIQSNYFIYCNGNSTNTITTVDLSNNSLMNYSLQTNSGNFYGIYNNGLVSTNLSVNTNSIVNANITGTNSSGFFIQTTGPVLGNLNINANLISSFSNTMNANGTHNYIYNRGNVSGNMSVSNNVIHSQTLSSNNASTTLIYNTGTVSNSLSINSNSVSGINHVSSGTALFHDVYNYSGSSAFLSISGNTFQTLNLGSGSGSFYHIYNRANGTQSISTILVANNLLSALDFTSNTGSIFGIYNNGFNFNNLSVSNNTLINIATTSTTGARYMLFNSANGTNLIQWNDNLISNVTSTLNTSGLFYDLYNAGACTGDFIANNNRFFNHNLTSSTASIVGVQNAGAISNSMAITGNTISGMTYSSSGGPYYGLINNGINAATISISSNSLININSTNSVSPKYLIYNAASASNLIQLNTNGISAYANTVNVSGVNYLLTNSGSSSGAIDISGNTINDIAVTTSTSAFYGIYNSGNVNTGGTKVRLSSNTFSTIALSSVSGSIYNLYTTGNSAGNLEMNDNQIANSVISHSVGSVYLQSNSGTIAGSISFTNNSIFSNTVTTASAVNWYGIWNTGDAQGNIDFIQNSISNSTLEDGQGSMYIFSNSGNVNSNLSFSSNSISSFELVNSTTGDFNYLHNSGDVSSDLTFSSNSISSTSLETTSGNVSLIANTGTVNNTVSFLSNQLSCGFSNTLTNFSGNFGGISNLAGATSGSVQVLGNNFTNIDFNGVNGTGNLYFVRNTANNSLLTISSNSWTNLNLNHSGNQHLIYNPSSTQNSLSVSNNSIVGSYVRTGSAGSLFLYYANGNSPSSCAQSFLNNRFSNITANTQGTGSFYGFYNTDGMTSPFPKKTFSNNLISNVTYNGLGFLFGYYLDFLGDGNSLSGSSIVSNTLSNVSWSGPLYGISVGVNHSPTYTTEISQNDFLTTLTNGQNAETYAAYLNSGSGAIHFHKNKISDISSSGTSGTANGVYVGGSGTSLISNNLIGNIYTPNSSALNALNAVYVNGSGTVNLLYNTIYLNASNSSLNFGSNSLYASTTTQLNLQNNILINLSTPNGSGITACYRRSSNNLNTYGSTSNNNIFYSGIPSTNHVIYADGTNASLILPNFQSLVNPRETNSQTENTGFASTVGTNTNYLHINVTLPSLTNNGAVNTGGITDDYDFAIRQGNVGYTGIGTAPDAGADEYDDNLTPCSSVNSGTAFIPTSNLLCSGESAYLISNGATAAGGINYQWKVSTTSGGPYSNVIGGSGANSITYNTASLTAGVYYYVISTTCTNTSNNMTSNEVTVTVNQTPTASVAGPLNALCSGQDIVLLTTSAGSNSFYWLGPNNYSSTVQSPTISNASSNASGTYTLFTSNLNCTTVPVAVNVTVYPTPPQFSLSPSAASICAGSSQTISASIPITTPTLNFGSQTYQNSASGYPAPYSLYYGGQKMQMLVLAGELASAGFTVGTPIQSLQFAVNALGVNWGNTIADCKNFQIAIKSTTTSQLFSFENGLTTVYGPLNYTPTIGTSNLHSFTSSFIWDGVSNIVIEVMYSNNIAGTSGNSVIQNNSPTSFQSTLIYRADNQNISGIAAATSSNASIGFVRPDFSLNGLPVGSYTWSPSFGLSATNMASVTASPSTSIIYTVNLSNGQCISTSSIDLTVILTPTVTISSTSSLVCLGNNATLTANGATTYTWSNSSHNSSVVVSPFISSTYTVTGSNPACPNASDTITIYSAPALVLTSTMTPATLCQGETATVTVAGATTYTWTGGSTSNPLIITPSLTTNYTVNANNGPGCWASKIILAKVNPIPFVSITPNAATICPGQTITLEASGVFSFTWTNLNSYAPIIEVSPSVTTVYTVTGTDNNSCSNTASVMVTVDPCVSVGEMQNETAQILIYPNPNEGIFKIVFPNQLTKTITLKSALGAELFQFESDKISEQFDISKLNKGIYFIVIRTQDSTSIRKIILN